jgi:hypothetical protein
MPKRQRAPMSLDEMLKVSKGGKRKPAKPKPKPKKETRGQEMDRGVLGQGTRLGKILMSGHDTTPDERN